MKKLETYSMVMLALGIVLCLYGWSQSWGFSAHSDVWETIFMKRTIRMYVFSSLGAAFLFFSYILGKINDETAIEVMKLSQRISNLETKTREMSKANKY